MSIRRLPEDVVNRIAAGEILVRPSNAVKELIENSIDADATNISVIIGNGGLQTIQIIDDGRGIAFEDHPLVCERFATSKLRSADELSDGKVLSFGFRGEALASMSMVGHVTVYSKCVKGKDEGGFESRYQSGKLVDGYPKLVAFNGVSGTRIVVDDLFFDNPVRKKGFKQPSVEYKRILDIVSRFAVSFPNISFRVKKVDSTNYDLLEEVSGEVSRVARIETLYGVRNLWGLTLQEDDDPPEHLKNFEILTPNPMSDSFSSEKGSVTIVLVNNRLVDSVHLMKLIESEMISVTRTKVSFVFLSLSIDFSRVDFNVCPTKSKVVYANQSSVDRWIVDKISQRLNESRRSKTLKINTIRFDPVSFKAPEQLAEKKTEEPPSQQFKIHTCPKQNFFVSAIQPSQEVFIELTQVDKAPLTKMTHHQTQLGLEEFCNSITSSKLELTLNPRDFVWIGEVGEGFALCQFHSRLCICNVRFTFVTVVARYLLLNNFSLSDLHVPIETAALKNIPQWVCDVISDGDGRLKQLPSIRNNPTTGSYIVDSLLSKLNHEFSDLNYENVEKLSEVFAEYIFETEFGPDISLAWNEVIRNRNFCDVSSVGRDSAYLELLSQDDRKNFFFREVISLKDVYKEFERC